MIISNVKWIVIIERYTIKIVILSIDIRIMYLPAIRLLAILGGLSSIERYTIKCYTQY